MPPRLHKYLNFSLLPLIIPSEADVSLYRNEFDQLVSEAAFGGTISDTDMSSTSPEFGTDRYYAKCWVRRDDGIFLYKTGSALNVIEPVSEFLASQIVAWICPDCVRFAPHPEIEISQSRLELLSGIVNRQIQRILE